MDIIEWFHRGQALLNPKARFHYKTLFSDWIVLKASIFDADDYSVEEERPIYAEESYYPNNEMSFEEQKML